jgi:hypothetical protein
VKKATQKQDAIISDEGLFEQLGGLRGQKIGIGIYTFSKEPALLVILDDLTGLFCFSVTTATDTALLRRVMLAVEGAVSICRLWNHRLLFLPFTPTQE